MIVLNDRLCQTIAFKKKGRLEFDDAYQHAMIGLVKGIEKWEPEKGRLSTYAVWWMRQEIGRANDLTTSLVRTPAYQMGNIYKNAIRKQRSDEPDLKESKYLQQAMAARFGYVNIDRGRSETPGLHEVFEDQDFTKMIDEMHDADHARVKVSICIALLKRKQNTQRTLKIIRMRFGLHRERKDPLFGAGMTLKEIAEVVSLTRERVRQILNSSFDFLKKYLEKLDTMKMSKVNLNVKFIKNRIKRMSMTIHQFAQNVGVQEKTMSMYLKKIMVPGSHVLHCMSMVLDVDQYVLEDEKSPILKNNILKNNGTMKRANVGNLDRAMKAMDMTIMDLARKTNLNNQTIRNIIKGKRSLVVTLQKLAKELHVDCDFLTGENGEVATQS